MCYASCVGEPVAIHSDFCDCTKNGAPMMAHADKYSCSPIRSIPVAVDMSCLPSVLTMTLRRGGEVKAVFAFLNKGSFAGALV